MKISVTEAYRKAECYNCKVKSIPEIKESALNIDFFCSNCGVRLLTLYDSIIERDD